MKKKFLLLGCLLGLVGLIQAPTMAVAYAEEPAEVEVQTYTISYKQPEHGLLKIDEEQLSGNVGDVVEIHVDPDMFYLIDYVKVNDTSLVENETTKGLYTFTPVAGENVVSVNIILNAELFGEFNTIAKQVEAHDWTSIFSVDTVLKIVSTLLSSGLLIAIITYFIKDKKLSDKIEKKVEESFQKIMPEETKNIVLEAIEKQISPIFEKNEASNLRVLQALSVFSKCFALSQQDTPESKTAIIDELTSLNIGDYKTLEEIKNYIEEQLNAKEKEKEENLKRLQEIEEKVSEDINEETIEEEEENKKIRF